jgi:hypothetical protein
MSSDEADIMVARDTVFLPSRAPDLRCDGNFSKDTDTRMLVKHPCALIWAIREAIFNTTHFGRGYYRFMLHPGSHEPCDR